MKRLLILFLVTSSAGAVQAREIARNPDRFPSIGLNIENYKVGGQQTDTINLGLTVPTETGSSMDQYIGIGADVRLPVTDSMTLSFAYLGIDGESVRSRSAGRYENRSNMNGYKASVGVRLYLNK